MSPWRPLIALAAIIVALGGTMLGTGHHTPQLGIDLAGGSSVTMTAKGPTPTPGNMDTAVSIIRNRVNGFGVSEAEVTKQGSSHIQIDVPGKGGSDVLDQVGKTAELLFRVVVTDPTLYGAPARTTVAPTPPPTSPSGAPSTAPSASGTPAANPSGKASSTPSGAKTPATPASSATQHRAVDSALLADAPTTTPSGGATTPSGGATTPSGGAATPSGGATPSAAPSTPAPAADGTVAQTKPSPETIQLYETIDCTKPPTNLGSLAKPNEFAVGCDLFTHQPYLLEPAAVLGKDVTSASAQQGQTSQGIVTGTWQVNLSFDGKATKQFADVTQQVYQSRGQFAVVLDGVVYSAPTVTEGAITGGQAQITGNFTQKTATDLANVLKFGQLPVTFEPGDVQQVSASLAGSQLTAGLLAGGVGLLLVVVYLIAYYRGLSIVAVASLVISGALTYMIATLLGPSIGFRLSLAGVAGLVVAIGITADSFVVFFERLRDEVREGRTLRTAVDHGWSRARRTILAADFVSFLAAAVLYVVSVGTVRGFAFTLGLTTLLDIVVVFMFTKPMMTLLARRRFFSDGHPWSGLDPERLGVKRSSVRETIISRRRGTSADAEGMEA